MSLLSLIMKESPPPSGPVDPKWRRNERGYFHRLLSLEVESLNLGGVGGVYAIWHRGVRPEWVYVGATTDLGSAILAASHNADITDYEINGGLFVTWTPIVEEYRDGVVNFLRKQLKPVIDEVPGEHIDASAQPIAVLPPQ